MKIKGFLIKKKLENYWQKYQLYQIRNKNPQIIEFIKFQLYPNIQLNNIFLINNTIEIGEYTHALNSILGKNLIVFTNVLLTFNNKYILRT